MTNCGPTVSDAEQVRRTIDDTLKDFGRIDILVANAGEHFFTFCSFARVQLGFSNIFFWLRSGMAISKPILEQTLEEYKKQMSVNGRSNSLSLIKDCHC